LGNYFPSGYDVVVMRRRYYLSLLAAGAVAGCNTGEEPTETETDTAPGTDARTTEPEAPEQTTPAEPTDETPPETDEPTETEAEPSEAERRAAQQLTRGEELLGEALDRYAAIGTAASLLDVRAPTTQFDWVSVAVLVRDARGRFETASRVGTNRQSRRAEKLTRFGAFVRGSARVQSRIGEAYETVVDLHAAHLGENTGSASVATDRLRQRTDTARDLLDATLEESDPADADAYEGFSADDYRAKVDQFEAELAAFRSVLDTRRQFGDGLVAWRDAARRYVDERWSVAATGFETAAEELAEAAAGLDADDVDDERFDGRYRTYRSVARSLADAAEAFGDSAGAYRQGDDGEGDERRRDGQRRLRDEETVTDMTSVRRLTAYSGP
jgi:uncharacterized protein YukE